MINQNKILTVSYGTFSCTLEGFDDPFSTMKAIVEYFRDLAAEDRYFGAEPPQPDAAMLKLIAEREMQRRIDAKIGENSVVLRASEPELPNAVPEAQAAPKPAPEVTQPAPQSLGAPDAQPEPVVQQEITPPAPQLLPEADETVAAKLARIRNAVAKARIDALVPGQTDLMNEATEIAPETAVLEPPVLDPAPAALAPDFPALDSDEWFEDTQLAGASDDDLDLGAVMAARAEPLAPDAEESVEDTASAEGSFDSEAEIEASETPDAPALAEAKEPQTSLELSAEPEGFDDEFDIAALNAQLSESGEPSVESGDDSILTEDAAQEETAEDDTAEDDSATEEMTEDTAVPADADAAADESTVEEAAPEQEAKSEPAAEATSEPKPEADVSQPPQRIIRIRRRAKANAEAETVAEAAAKVDGEAEVKVDVEAKAEEDSEIAAKEAPEAVLPPEAEAELAEELARMSEDLQEPQAPVTQTEEEIDDAALKSALASLESELADAEIVEEAPQDFAAPSEVAEKKVEQQPQDQNDDADAVEEQPESSAQAESVAEVDAEDDDEATMQAALRATMGDTLGDSPAVEPAKPEARDETAAPRPVRPSRPTARPSARSQRPAAVVAPSRPRRAALERGPDDSAEADRLLRQTNDELAGPENRRRVATIAHLKAAVAATVADRLSRGEGVDSAVSDPADEFRADLAKAVRPRRPVAVPGGGAVSPTRPGTPARDRIPPLVLISEQRVPKAEAAADADDDVDDDAETLDAPNIFAASGEFTDFGQRMGATTAADWMEAAAAHLMLKDGLDLFTRPQLIGRMLSHPPIVEKLDREAQLTLFGTLLREGRLVKPRRGQFSLSESSAMLAQARRLAG